MLKFSLNRNQQSQKDIIKSITVQQHGNTDGLRKDRQYVRQSPKGSYMQNSPILNISEITNTGV